MNIELLITSALMHTVALASPGPDFALVVKLASQESRQVAIAAACGIAFSILVHTVLSLTGVSLVIESSQTLFFIVQLLGSGYLAWIGVGAIKSALKHWRDKYRGTLSENSSHDVSVKQGFMQGFYTNLLNPKAMVFFITLISVVISPEETTSTKVAIAVIFLSLSLLWFVFIALILSKPNVQQKVRNATPIINLMTGILFVNVALVIASRLFF
jgi:RhtB (resistance to homoserine/threonine) family protein